MQNKNKNVRDVINMKIKHSLDDTVNREGGGTNLVVYHSVYVGLNFLDFVVKLETLVLIENK